MTDPRGKVTTTAYDATYGYVSSVTHPLSHATSYIVDPGWGVQTKITDPNNKVTELQYDSFGRLQKVWLPSEPKSGVASLEFVYDAAARPAWVKSRTLQVKGSSTYLDGWSYVDGFGRAIQSQAAAVTAGQRIVSSQKYNNLGQLAYQSAPYQLAGAAGSGYSAPNWTTVANYHYLQYEELGNVWLDETKSTTSVLWSTTTVYDAWQTRAYDPRGNRTDYDRDGFGQLAKVTEYTAAATFFATNYAYDLQGNLTGVTDAASNSTTMTYDLLGRKLTMSDPDMGSWQYQYDGNGNLTGQRDGRSLWLYMAYDDLNRLVSKRKDNATTGALIADYVYDATGQKGLLSKSRAYDAAGTTEVQSVTYDARNRVTQQKWIVPGTGGGTFRMDYALNEADQRTSLTYPGGTTGQQGEVVSYTYNAIGQLTGVSGSSVSYLASATYNAQGQPTQMVNDSGANGLTRKWSYETNTLRLSVLQAGKNGTFDDRQKLTYAYDNNGNVTSQLNTLNSNQRQCFEYDWLNRLTKAYTTGNATCGTYTATGTGPYNHTYEYNAIGNITSYAGSAYTYGDTNHKHAVTAAFGNSYSYDLNGNQTSRTIGGVAYTFTYDYENRLTAISGGSVTASFTYDAGGNRVKGTVGGVTTVYVAGIFEQQGSATTKYYEGNALRRTGYGADNGVFYLLRDHLNSSSVITNQAGAALTTSYYYPFGGNRGSAFSAITTKRFTGQYHESTLPGGEGLSYYNARWYDAKLGRFLSADTIVPGPANPQAFNRYSYGLNNPLGFTDPTGHVPCRAGTKCISSTGVTTRRSSQTRVTNSSIVVTCAGLGCLTTRSRSQSIARRPATVVSRKPASTLSQPSSWVDRYITNTRKGLPLAKELTKTFWGCAIGNCDVSMNDWTGSVDFGGMWSPVGVAARGTISVAVDHEGGLALVGSIGTGGSTPTVNVGVGATVTNAPSINHLAGDSVQFGGSVDLGVGIFAEGVFFADSHTGDRYGGISVSAVGSFPDPLVASVHGTAERSWVLGVNLIDVLFYPVEQLLSED